MNVIWWPSPWSRGPAPAPEPACPEEIAQAWADIIAHAEDLDDTDPTVHASREPAAAPEDPCWHCGAPAQGHGRRYAQEVGHHDHEPAPGWWGR